MGHDVGRGSRQLAQANPQSTQTRHVDEIAAAIEAGRIGLAHAHVSDRGARQRAQLTHPVVRNLCQDSMVEPPDVARAIAAAISIVVSLGLTADDAIVVQDSNKLALRLLPCDVFARVGHVGQEHARFEVELAKALAHTGSPVAALEPRVEPRGYEHDGFEVTLWTYYEPATPEISPAAYADALQHLHAGMRTLDVPTPHFADRVEEAEHLVTSRELTPELTDMDRAMLAGTLRRLRRAIGEHGAEEQMLHGEPHPGNLLSTARGPLFVDLETCCRGPVEFDLAHVPQVVSEHYPGVDLVLLRDCRQLVLAMVAAWRWDRDDQFPNRMAFGRELLSVLRAGPPWPTIDAVIPRLDDP